ncbi:transcription elongation factor B polypeptide 3-like [Euwallacea fornicatus]|uniref:transcription elongation factor B polypeptide 3-like n=1 Tax=Euwallacea fornicatus TaxID=995702 RepID=UPI00339070B9
MSDSKDKLIKAIKHYQESLEKHSKSGRGEKLLHAIERLATLPIRVWHLEETGVGRTVNGLKRYEGEVGENARNLVDKWKCMVKEEEDEEQAKLEEPDVTSVERKKDKVVEEPGSHRGIHHKEEENQTLRYQESNVSSHKKSCKKSTERMNNNSDKKRQHSSDKSDSDRRSKKLKVSDKHKEIRRKSESSDDSESEIEKDDNASRRGSESESSDDDSSSDDSDSESEDNGSSSKSEEEERKCKKKEKPEAQSNRDKQSKTEEKKSRESQWERERDIRSKSGDHKTEKENVSKSSRTSTTAKESRRDSKSSSSKDKSRSSEKDLKQSDKSEKNKRPRRNSSSEQRHKHETSRHKNSSSSNSKERKHEDDVKKSRPKEEKFESKKETSPKKKFVSDQLVTNGIDSGCGASFADVLGMLETPLQSKSKKKITPEEKPSFSKSTMKEPSKSNNKLLQANVPPLLKDSNNLEPLVDINISSLLPSITPNYRPLGLPVDGPNKKLWMDDEALSRVITAKHQRTKVFSGNKSTYNKVPSLFNLCCRILQDNLDALEYTGGVPYSILKPILEKATPDQLYQLEFHNPYVIAETDELWQLHCQKEFRNRKREEMETWREMYLRCLDEREARLKALTANIKQSQDRSVPVRQTKLAYVDSVVKPPRNVARKQAKNGTAVEIKRPSQTPTERLNQLAKSGEAGKVSVPNPGRAAYDRGSGSISHSSHLKPKKAPLMAKSLSLLKNRFGRR